MGSKDFVIEDGKLVKYIGELEVDCITIPHGVHTVVFDDFKFVKMKKLIIGKDVKTILSKNGKDYCMIDELVFEKGCTMTISSVNGLGAKIVYYPKGVNFEYNALRCTYSFYEGNPEDYTCKNVAKVSKLAESLGRFSSGNAAVFGVDIDKIEDVNKMARKGYAYFKTTKGLYVYDINQEKAKFETLFPEINGEKVVGYLANTIYSIDRAFGNLALDYKKHLSEIDDFVKAQTEKLIENQRHQADIKQYEELEKSKKWAQEDVKSAKVKGSIICACLTLIAMAIGFFTYINSKLPNGSRDSSIILITSIFIVAFWIVLLGIVLNKKSVEKKINQKMSSLSYILNSVKPSVVSGEFMGMDFSNKIFAKYDEKARLEKEIMQLQANIRRLAGEICSGSAASSSYTPSSNSEENSLQGSNNLSSERVVYDGSGRVAGRIDESDGSVIDDLGRHTGYKVDGNKLYNENADAVGFIDEGKVHYYDES